MFDIVSLGSATIDILLKSPHFPLGRSSVGEKIEVEELFLSSGGGGTNTAAGFARLGLSTACVARFGDDLFGGFVLKNLQREKFDLKYLIKKTGDTTDCSVVLVNPDGSRTILVNRGKTKIDSVVFPWQVLEETKWLYIASLEGNVDLLTEIVAKAKEKGTEVVLNPGNRELQAGEKLRPVFSQIKALVLNRGEADEFGIHGRWETGPEIVVITNGCQGVKLFCPKVNLFAEAFVVPVVDETGAGDAFSAGFVAGLVKGLSLKEALKLGVANGASVVSQFGAKSGLLRENEAADWLGRSLRIESGI